MKKFRDPLDLAMKYNAGMPRRIRQYLNDRGIPDEIIDFRLLGWNGNRITIPIFNREGGLVFFKLAQDPEDRLSGPKIIASPGAYVELYGWDQILSKPSQLIICEGEFDRLVLEANWFRAVTSTGGAGSFRWEWAKEFEAIPEVYICFDRDEAGRNGALRVGHIIPHAKLIRLPEEVGEGGDVTDFFIRLGKSREDFLKLMEQAAPVTAQPEPAQFQYQSRTRRFNSYSSGRVRRIKTKLPVEQVIGQYVKLRKSYSAFTGLCPFHQDHNPSLTVYPASGTFHCYGCSKHGDVITFLIEKERMSFPQALDALDRLIENQHDH